VRSIIFNSDGRTLLTGLHESMKVGSFLLSSPDVCMKNFSCLSFCLVFKVFFGNHCWMQVFSWEPLRCHDAIDIGWSKLADLNIHEGKLLACSYNQNCVGIWVVDLSV
jgi:hypothetical protein